MKLKDFLNQFEGYDPETEIYRRSDENDDGEIYLNFSCPIVEMSAIQDKFGNKGLYIPNHTVCKIHNPIQVMTI